MKKKIFILTLFILACFFITDSVSALSFSELRMYYKNDQGETLSINNRGFGVWGAYGTDYIDKVFDNSSFGDIPDALYGFFNSGQGCVNKNCVLEGVVVSYTPYGLNNQNYLANINVQVEANGSYKSCSIVDLSTEYNIYSYAKFQCSNYNLNSGFNVVITNFGLSNATKYGLATSSFRLLDNLTTEDIIVNSSANTENIINNQNQNSQNIINNQNQNSQNIINNQNQNQQQTNEKLDDLNNSLNDDSAPDTSNAFSDINLNTNSAISNLVLMPINYLNRVLALSNNSCSAYSIDFGIFGSDYKLTLPCIKLENFFGSQWWNVIDYMICFYMIYNFVMLAISAFEDITSLRDSYESLYQPKHADTGYKPKHGGD